MFSKNLAIILAISCLSAVPAFAQVHDVDVDKDATHAVDKDKDQGAAVTRKAETSGDKADAIRSVRDGKSNDLSKSALDAISAHINGAQSKVAVGGDVTTEIINAHIGIHNILINTAADMNGEKGLAGINHSNFETYLANVKELHTQVMDKLLDGLTGEQKGRAETMVRAFRHLLMGEGGSIYHANPSTLAEAIQTYVKSVAGDNWAHIEEQAGLLKKSNPSLTDHQAKLDATVAFIKSKHPEMKDDMVKSIANDIVDEKKGCV